MFRHPLQFHSTQNESGVRFDQDIFHTGRGSTWWWGDQVNIVSLSCDLDVFRLYDTKNFLHIWHLKHTHTQPRVYTDGRFLACSLTVARLMKCFFFFCPGNPTSSRSIFLTCTGLLAPKIMTMTQEAYGERIPWSWGTVNSSPRNSRSWSRQNTHSPHRLCMITVRLSSLRDAQQRRHVSKNNIIDYEALDRPHYRYANCTNHFVHYYIKFLRVQC